MMTNQIGYRCADHPDPFDCPDNLVSFSTRRRQYGLIVHDGGKSYVRIQYCPWCGTQLPTADKETDDY